MMMNEYKPIAGEDKTFQLAEPTVARDEKIHAIQVRYPGVSLEERQVTCRLMKWKPEERIPELFEDVRVSVSALKKLAERNKEKPANAYKDLVNLCESRMKEHTPVGEQLSSKEYWYEIACVLLQGFDQANVRDKGQLNFRVISQAYTDFFGL